MEGFFIFMIILAVAALLSGPVALIISIISLRKNNENRELLRQMQFKAARQAEPTAKITMETPKPAQAPVTPPPPPLPQQPKATPEMYSKITPLPVVKDPLAALTKNGTLEQLIGTKWVLIAGVITVIVGVGLFLKYAYDTALIGPRGRVVIAAVAGMAALCIGEVTRKRGLGIAARGVTALGFAILYAAVFSAYRFYGLIDSIPAFALAVLVTLAAMLYAVSLNEIIIAVLSLLGGFLTPVILSTGENLPVPLFCYVLVLAIGAMICACYRKWRPVTFIAFAGTFVLYTGWFEKFYRPAMRTAEKAPEQLAIALGWLGVFFAIFLLLPLLNGLVKKIKAQKEDVLLVLTNAGVTFYYLWTILFAKYRMELAFCAVALCIAHLVIMAAVTRRCSQDLNLRLVLLVMGLFFLTVAIPLYLKMYAVAMAWAIEAVVLVVIGLKYRSVWTQLASAAAIVLSLAQLLHELPMHSGAFAFVLNPAFGTWLFVAAAIAVCHVLYRQTTAVESAPRQIISQILYCAATIVLMGAVMMEWFWHCDYNIAVNPAADNLAIRGTIAIFAVFTLLFVMRPLCPTGRLCKFVAAFIGLAASVFTMIAFNEIYHSSFTIFANSGFALAILFVAALFIAAHCLKQSAGQGQGDIAFSHFFALLAIFVLWVLLSEQIYLYWYCKNRYTQGVANWRFLSNMYISVMWAIYGAILMTAGFWRKNPLLRYISLGLLALLLAKVFILDMGTVRSVYRIAAFLATGVTLVGISYLYQFLKNKGFFEPAGTKKLHNQ